MQTMGIRNQMEMNELSAFNAHYGDMWPKFDCIISLSVSFGSILWRFAWNKWQNNTHEKIQAKDNMKKRQNRINRDIENAIRLMKWNRDKKKYKIKMQCTANTTYNNIPWITKEPINQFTTYDELWNPNADHKARIFVARTTRKESFDIFNINFLLRRFRTRTLIIHTPGKYLQICFHFFFFVVSLNPNHCSYFYSLSRTNIYIYTYICINSNHTPIMSLSGALKRGCTHYILLFWLYIFHF